MRELGEHREVAAGGLGLGRARRAMRVDVAVEVADDGVELAERRSGVAPRGERYRGGRRARLRDCRGAVRDAGRRRRALGRAPPRPWRRATARARTTAGAPGLDADRGAARRARRRRRPPAASLTRLLCVDAGGARRARRPRRRPALEPTTPTPWRAGSASSSCASRPATSLGLDDARGRRRARWPRSADDVLDGRLARSAAEPALAVIGMGKLGGRELNYASDVDVMFVGERRRRRAPAAGDRRARCFRVDADLRPEGRDGPLVRSLESYEAYWDRWAAAVGVPGPAQGPAGGRRRRARRTRSSTAAAARALWERPFTADDLRSVRGHEGAGRGEVARKGLGDREVKRGRGGIRDIEFAVQLLQLVHGRARPRPALARPRSTRSPSSARAGYVDRRRRRRARPRLPLPAHRRAPAAARRRAAGPRRSRPTPAARDRLARVARATATRAERRRARAASTTSSGATRRRCGRSTSGSSSGRCSRRSPGRRRAACAGRGRGPAGRLRLHRRRAHPPGRARADPRPHPVVPAHAAAAAAAARVAVASRPTPTSGCSGCAGWLAGRTAATELANAFRESPEAARRLCLVLGTSRLLGRPARAPPRPRSPRARPTPPRWLRRPRRSWSSRGHRGLGWRDGREERRRGPAAASSDRERAAASRRATSSG